LDINFGKQDGEFWERRWGILGGKVEDFGDRSRVRVWVREGGGEGTIYRAKRAREG
jgi:hypothetical protein